MFCRPIYNRAHRRCPVKPILLGLLLATWPALAAAEDADATVPPVEADRRGGFTLGLNVSPAGTGVLESYPNKIDQIDDPRYAQNLDWPLLSSWGVFIGATPRDWLTVGVAMRGQAASQNDRTFSGGMVGLRLEGYPAYALGGHWRDVGLSLEVGAGFAQVVDPQSKVLSEGGSLSSISVGGFWDAWRFWHLGVGPGVSYLHEQSATMTFDAVTFNLRAAFYATLLDG